MRAEDADGGRDRGQAPGDGGRHPARPQGAGEIAAPAPPLLAVEARRRIRASAEHVFAHLAHPEHLPRYAAPLWMAADAPEKRGSTHLVTLRGYFIGLPVEALVKIISHQPSSLDVMQIHGTLRAFLGRFGVRSVEDGAEIVYHVEADPGIPMLTDAAARQFLVQHVERLLDRIKLAAERKAPSRRPRPAAPPTAAGPAATVAEADEEEGAGEAEAAVPPLPVPLPPTRETSREKTALAGPNEVGRASVRQDEAGGREARPEGAPSGHRRRRRRRRRHHGPPAPGSGGAPSGQPAA